MKTMNILKSIKKTLGLFTLTILSSIALSSCSKESIEETPLDSSLNESTLEQKIDLDNWGGGNGSGNGNVFVALVEGDSCGNGKFSYTIYASATQIKPYDREVQAGVIKNGNIIEAKVLIIPANQYVSSNAPAFVGASQSHGTVISKSFNVLNNGTIESDYNFPNIQHDISNCTTGSGGGNCSFGLYASDDASTAATNEGPGDQDGDGECNILDPDDNGNGIADAWED